MINTSASILVVDDQTSMRTTIAGSLRSLGFKDILLAQNAKEAMQILKTHPVNLILSDWNMPEMSGLELLQWVRQKSINHRYTPLIMLTAEVKREQVKGAIESGVSDFILKPFTIHILAERIQKVLSKASSPASYATGKPAVKALDPFTLTVDEKMSPDIKEKFQSSRKTTGKDEPITILAVDDTPDNLTLISNIFQEEYRVKIATNGEKAISICTSDDPPNLVLLDIMMPGMDGFEVIRRLKANEVTAELPVIFITALNDAQSIARGLNAGAVDYVTKPIEPTVLKARVANFLRFHRGYEELKDTLDTIMENAKLREDVEHLVRHDMKSPLSAIIGMVSQAIADGQISPQTLKMVEESAYSILHMINLSTDLYKMEAGTFILNAKPVDIGRLINRIAEEVRSAFTSKKLTILMLPSSQNTFVSGDELLCYSMLHNVMKNAAEAAPNDSTITVAISEGPQIKIAVHNLGTVPEPIRDKFFQKFVTMGKQGGTGLGTYSARLIAEAQKGTIEMQTSGESGTTIEISLPSVSV